MRLRSVCCEKGSLLPDRHRDGTCPIDNFTVNSVWKKAICLIPYIVDHPFNQACSPTKIMDCMGTGRPVVSTSIPECRLYEHLFHVADDNAFLESIRSVLDQDSDDGRAALRYEWALANTCAATASRLVDLIPS